MSIPSLAGMQIEKVNLEMKSVSIQDIIEEIGNQTGIGFLYKGEELKDHMVNEVNFEDKEWEEVLTEILDPIGKTFKFEKDLILIIDKPEESVETKTNQKRRKVKGTVTDTDGNELPGVSVTVKGTTRGVSTDINGNYTLYMEGDKNTLIFSFVGMLGLEIEYTGQSLQNVTLTDDHEQMAEVTVYATGLTKISKERATGAFVQLKSAQLEQRPVANILQKLEGTVAGLNSTNGKLSIRGIGTFVTSSSPLIVVDGFPLTNDENTVNPEDVESITVLKDAAAASIWGTQASNGVIVITTKRGKAGEKLKVNFSGYMTMSEKINYNDANVIGTSDQIDMQLESIDKNWIDLEQRVGYGNYSFSLVEEALIYRDGLAPNGNVWTGQQYNTYIEELRGRELLDQWSDHFIRNEVKQIYNLSLSGSGEKNRTYASVNYTDKQSAQIGVDNDQIKLNIQNIYKYNDKLSFESGVNISIQNSQNNGAGTATPLNNYGYKLFVDEDGNYIKNYDKYNRWVSNEREASDASIMSYYSNVLEEQRAMDNTSQRISMRARFALGYEIFKGLKFNSMYQYQQTKYDSDNYSTMDRPSQRIKLNEMYVDGAWQLPQGTEYRYGRNSVYSWDFRNTLTFDRSFGKHSITLFGGMDIRKVYSDGMSDKMYGYNEQTGAGIYVNEADLAAGIFENWLGRKFTDKTFYRRTINDVREFSVYANLAYEFDNRYLATGSFRIDQKNLFGSDSDFRYKPLSSVGLGWKISNEDFFDVSWLNRLVVKATYGLGGNASSIYGPYAQATVYNPLRYGIQYSYEYATIKIPANEKLKWEETTTLNLSTDFEMFDNRISGILTYYYKKGTELLGRSALDPSVGFSYATVNYGSIDNRGIEFSLKARLLKKNGFVWTLGGNISYNKNRILDYRISQTAMDMLGSGDRSKGNPYHNIVSTNYAGLDGYGNALLNITNESGEKVTTQYSKEQYSDLHTDDLIYHGASIAPCYGGLSSTFSYKGFDLTMNATFKFGHYFRAGIGSVGLYAGKTRAHSAWANRWMESGDENNTRIPKFAYNGINPYNNEYEAGSTQTTADISMYNYSQDVVLNAGYLRVRDIILGYNLPKNILNKTFLKSLRITGQVSNPFLWTVNKKGYDPEAYGTEYYSNLKVFTFGIRGEF
ncbi:MAG: SusC/RagA family TonB-linked outer membrane protein [Labilibaculum sp.]|nr:SusC/RagA family TonB-linked outer membrane protein [Labilibaculum sp.]